MSQELPSYHQAYNLLRREGRYFADNSDTLSVLGNLTYRNSRGTEPIMVEERLLANCGYIYAETDVRRSLAARGVRSSSLGNAYNLLGRFLNKKGQVWGFSGFATGGIGCAAEASTMLQLYDNLERAKNLPTAVSDGSSSFGVLGLNGLIARQRHIPTIGYAPRAGMGSFAPRDHLIVKFDSYREREVLVGSTPDVLVCVGGGAGTEREALAALKLGSVVFLVAPKPNDLLNVSKLHAASQPDRFITWTPRDNLQAKTDQAIIAGEYAQKKTFDSLACS